MKITVLNIIIPVLTLVCIGLNSAAAETNSATLLGDSIADAIQAAKDAGRAEAEHEQAVAAHERAVLDATLAQCDADGDTRRAACSRGYADDIVECNKLLGFFDLFVGGHDDCMRQIATTRTRCLEGVEVFEAICVLEALGHDVDGMSAEEILDLYDEEISN